MRTFRARALAGIALAVTLAAAACGSDASKSGNDTSAKAPQSASESGAATSSEDGLVIDGEVIVDQQTLDAALEEGKLVLYTTGTETGTTATNERFTEQTGIEVEFFRGPGAEMTQRILAESSGGVDAWDVVALTSPGDMISLKDEGLLASYPLPDKEKALLVPEEIDPDKTYYPLYAWLYVIGVNRGVVEQDVTVESWDDILQDEFKGLLGITPAGVGGTGLAQASFQMEVLGEDYPERLAQVDPVIFSTTSTVAESLARGEISAGVLAESVAAPYIADGAPIELVYPDAGVIGGVSYQGVAERGPNPNAARVYQAWSLSKAGQDAIATAGGARSVREDAADAYIEGADLPPQSEITIWWSNLPSRLGTAAQVVSAWNDAVGYTK